MKFLADQDVYWLTIKELRKWGHEVITARELGMQKASDDDLLDKARELSFILLTRDKDLMLTIKPWQGSPGIIQASLGT